MADTGNRTLRLLSLMQARRHWAGCELADRLGVSLRTLRRDLRPQDLLQRRCHSQHDLL